MVVAPLASRDDMLEEMRRTLAIRIVMHPSGLDDEFAVRELRTGLGREHGKPVVEHGPTCRHRIPVKERRIHRFLLRLFARQWTGHPSQESAPRQRLTGPRRSPTLAAPSIRSRQP